MFVCYNYADNFLHLCIETYESQMCLTLAKNSSIMEKFFNIFRATIWCKLFKENKACFLAKQTVVFFL